MPPTNPKTLSPAELAKLEHAFATDPASEAYKPLAEAYLAMGRFMEAMVVCKKGVKAHPQSADPRVLLARVYADQGKDKKALEELQGALGVAPSDKVALRMTGAIQLKAGELEPGKANLLKAFQADPTDAETQALLTQHKLEVPRAAPPPPPPPSPAAVSPAAPAGPPVLRASPPPSPVEAQGSGAAPQRVNGLHGRGAAEPPPPPRAATRRPAPARDEEEEEDEPPRYRERSPREARRSNKSTFVLLLVVFTVGLLAYAVIGNDRARKSRELGKLLNEASKELKHDSFDSYKKACAAAEKALEVDPDSTAAQGHLAYAYAIRWGEHGGGDQARKQAEEHLAEALRAKKVDSQLYAAQALIQTYAGKGSEALRQLQERVRAFDAEGRRSSLLYLTLGIIKMNAGDLEGAREDLTTAQAQASDDPRIYAALGTLYRRRGQDNDAWKNFDIALRYETDHPDSMLGKSLLILDQDEPGYPSASKMLKKLLESTPPPSPRQLATAHLTRALLVSRLSRDLPQYKPEGQKALTEATGVTADQGKARAEIAREEDAGFTLDRSNPELYLIKGKRLLYEENVDAAAAEIRKAINLDGSRAHYHVELARALMRKDGGEREAEDALKKALSMNPSSPKLLAMLGHVYMKQNKLDDALRQYEASVKDPGAKNPEARLSMGRIFREKKDYVRAIDAFEKAAQEYVGQTYKVAQSYDEAGLTYEYKQDRTKAMQLYENAIKADGEYEAVYCHLAKLLAPESKNRARTKELAAKYLELAPRGECAADAQRLAQ